MNTSENAQSAEKAKNYSLEQVAELEAAAPIDLAKAKEFGKKFGKSYQSIISKCLSADIAYESVKPEPKRVNKDKTKAELVAEISVKLEGANLKGLEKATAVSLKNLFASLPVADESPA